MKLYKESVTRHCSLLDIQIWQRGESEEFKRVTGMGFFNTIFVSENNMATVYYDREEIKKFEQMLEEKLTEEFFDELCDDYLGLIEIGRTIKTHEGITQVLIFTWPAMTIFDEISKYPEWVTETMIKRLKRIRDSTESFHYNLSKKLTKIESPKDYIFYQGKVYDMNFEDFKIEKGIVIEY